MSELRRGYFSKEAKPGPWDVIVIGSGIGSMTAAALLTKLGRKVLVLEQHYVPGGFTHTFARKQWRWDVGVHAVGEVTTKDLPGRLMKALTDDRLRWASLGPVYDAFYYPGGFQLDFPDSMSRFRENLVRAFPRETAAIDRYLELADECADGIRGYFVSRMLPHALAGPAERLLSRKVQPYLRARTDEVLEKLTADPKLRSVFVAQWGYYGSAPSRSAFAMQVLVVKHFSSGGYYPRGGAAQIAAGLLGTVAAGGGWTRIMADVSQVLVEKGRATGVRLTSGEELRAPLVVSGIGAHGTLSLLPEPMQRESWARSLAELTVAPAHVCLYLGFKGAIAAAGATAANQWLYDTWDTGDVTWRVTPKGPQPRVPVLYVSFPSLKDPEHRGDLHTGEAVTFVPWETFLPWREQRWRNRGDDYAAFKASMQERMLEQLFAHRPELEPLLQFAELSTPITTDHFVRPSRGSIYGLEPTPERFANPHLKPRTPVPGLFLAGCDAGSVGVVGSLLGGMFAALAAEPWDAARWLARDVL